MKLINTIFFMTLFILLTAIMDKQLLSRSLFELFKDRVYTDEGLERVENFDPDNEILFLPELENKEFFQSINDLSICRRKEVRKYIYIYLTTGREYVKRSLENSEVYLDIIEAIIRENKMPDEIALLPILESGFNPYAVSKSRAVGLWQFIRGTSEVLGLKTDKWVEERRSIEKSTRAAARHLRNLYRIWGNWELVLASYNGGASHVKRAIQETGIENFWELQKTDALRTETSEYVPRFAALVVIYKHQELFDIKEELTINDIPETEKVVLDYPVNISTLSRVTGLSMDTLKKYNPELKRNFTPPYYKKYTLRLPVEVSDRIKKNEKKICPVRFRYLKYHTVKKGESISRIARRYGARAKYIILLNGIINPHLIHPGDKLYIPI